MKISITSCETGNVYEVNYGGDPVIFLASFHATFIGSTPEGCYTYNSTLDSNDDPDVDSIAFKQPYSSCSECTAALKPRQIVNNVEYIPTKFLVTNVLPGTTVPVDTIDDATSPYYGYPYSFQIDAYVDIQSHSSDKTRQPFTYDTNDIEVGNWLAQPTGKTYRIKQVIEIIDQQTVKLIIEDENLYNLNNDQSQQGNNYPDEDQPGFIFSLDEDGNPILSGITSQSAQFPGLVYWIEDIKSRFEKFLIDEEGIETYADWDQTVIQETEGDGAATGITIEYTPFQDSKVEVKVNGIVVNLGNGIKTKDCYFSNDGGVTAKPIKDIEAGDELYWNETYAGYRLDPSDDIDFDYEASNLDL